MKNQRITIKVDEDYRSKLDEKAKTDGLSISAYVRKCVDQYDQKPYQGPTPPEQKSYLVLQKANEVLQKELDTKNKQFEDLQKSLDQSQQLQALAEQRNENQRLQLDEYQRPKPLIARLKAVFVAKWHNVRSSRIDRD